MKDLSDPRELVAAAMRDGGDFLRAIKRTPKPHQLEGVRRLLTGPYGGFALFDDMGVGKTKQAVDAAQLAHVLGLVDTVVVVGPAQVRPIWLDPDPDLGELVKDRWPSLEQHVREFHSKTPSLEWRQGLNWVVTNYEYVRRGDPRAALVEALVRGRRRFVVVADEGGAVKGHKSHQTEAMVALRQLPGCRFGWLLNGTPVDNTPLDLYGQGWFMAGWPDRIFGLRSYFHFRARYAVMGGWEGKQILGYQNLEDLRRRMKPWCLRRLSKDVLDLKEPVDLPPLQVPLSKASWKLYKDMRDDLVAWLGTQMSVAPSGAVRVMRLSQLTGGFLGGLELAPALPLGDAEDGEEPADAEPIVLREVGREKQDALIEWWKVHPDANLKLVVWCRFRAEVSRLVAAFQAAGCADTYAIVGDQRRDERRAALAAFAWSQRDAPGRRVVVAQEQAGGLGLSLVAAHVAVTYSSGYSLRYRSQTRKRIDRPPQDRACMYMDILATGPDGQRTVDHVVRKALQKKDDLARWTSDYWRAALRAADTEAHF